MSSRESLKSEDWKSSGVKEDLRIGKDWPQLGSRLCRCSVAQQVAPPWPGPQELLCSCLASMGSSTAFQKGSNGFSWKELPEEQGDLRTGGDRKGNLAPGGPSFWLMPVPPVFQIQHVPQQSSQLGYSININLFKSGWCLLSKCCTYFAMILWVFIFS